MVWTTRRRSGVVAPSLFPSPRRSFLSREAVFLVDPALPYVEVCGPQWVPLQLALAAPGSSAGPMCRSHESAKCARRACRP